MKEKILDYLNKKHDYLSGDQISKHLGISRQGLWKHIQELKDSGYEKLARRSNTERGVTKKNKLIPERAENSDTSASHSKQSKS